MDYDVISNMTNIGESGQDQFVQNWSQMAMEMLYEQGISHSYLNSTNAQYIIAKAVTDLVEDGKFTITTESLIATLRANHPHTEDAENV